MSRSDAAAAWAARIDAGALDAPARAALDAWLSADPLNKGALLRAQAMLCLIDEAPAQSAAIEESEVAPEPARRRWLLWGGVPVAAALVGAIVMVGMQPNHARYATETGEIRRVAMDDGSRMVINTDTRIDTEITRRERLVALGRGEAWFQVAKDSARPFVVRAGPIRVRATGTAFAVRLDPASVTVTVTEGAVEVWNAATPGTRIPARAGQATTLAFAGTPIAPRVVTARESALAWRDGDIVLDGMTLGEAAAEFNRYNLRKIRIDRPALAAKPMVGYFKNNQPEQFAEAASSIIGGRAVHEGNNIVITTTENRNKKNSQAN